jgi:hypothetical protein
MSRPRAFTATALCLAAAAIAALLLARPCRPEKGAGEPREIIQAAAERAEEAAKAAAEAETKAVEARPKVAAAKRRARAASEGRAAVIPLEALPVAVQVEMEALADLAAELEAQVDMEAARGDAWKDAAEAEREVAAAVLEEGERQAKAAWRRGAKVGAGVAAAAVILILILL